MPPQVTANKQATGAAVAVVSRRRCPARSGWRTMRATGIAPFGTAGRTKFELAAFLSTVVADRDGARGVGVALAKLHETLKQIGASNVAVVSAALCFFGLAEDTPHARLAVALAAQADAMGRRHPYHNAGHLREVTVNMANLVALNATRHQGVVLGKNDLALALALAVSHDLGHDGATNDVPLRDAAGNPIVDADGKPATENVPFLLEDKAIATIMVAGRRAGISEADLRRMRAVVLITDPNTGYRVLDAALDPQRDPAATATLLGFRPELTALREPVVLRLATMLRDADVLGSCGTSAAENDRETARLEKERGLPAGGLHGRGTEHFIGTIARGKFLSPEGRFFQPNLEYLRALNTARLETADPRAVTLADMERLR